MGWAFSKTLPKPEYVQIKKKNENVFKGGVFTPTFFLYLYWLINSHMYGVCCHIFWEDCI